MIERSETLAELFKALSKAQGQIKPAIKDATNPHLRSKYADLGSVWEACREALADNGLSVTQWPITREGVGGITLMTVLGHTSGEFMMAAYTMPTAKADAQSYGSALTYSKRYALAAVLGIVADDDDDGHAASAPRGQQKAQQAPARSQGAPPASRPAQGDGEAIGEELAQRLHAQLGAILKGTPHAAMSHTAWASTVTGRDVAHLRDLTRAESKAVYNAAKAEQEQSAA